MSEKGVAVQRRGAASGAWLNGVENCYFFSFRINVAVHLETQK